MLAHFYVHLISFSSNVNLLQKYVKMKFINKEYRGVSTFCTLLDQSRAGIL